MSSSPVGNVGEASQSALPATCLLLANPFAGGKGQVYESGRATC